MDRLYLNDGWTVVDMLIAKVMVISPATSFRDAASKLGLEMQAGRFQSIAEWGRDDRERRIKRSAHDPASSLVEQRGALISAMVIPMIGRQAENPPPFTIDNIRPSRLAEHAFTRRALAVAACVIIAIATAAASLRFLMTSPLNRRLSARLTDLLRPGDWLLVLLGGTLLPVAFYLILAYLTPLSDRDWTLRGTGIFQLVAQAAAGLVLVMTTTTTLASSLLDRRLAAFGLCAASPRTGWIMLLCAIFALPITGAALPAFFILKLPQSAVFSLLGVGCALAAAAFIWLFAGLVKPLFGFKDSKLRIATLTRVTVHSWLCAFVILVSTMPLHHAIERHWLKKDKLPGAPSDMPAFTHYEWLVTQQLRKEIRDKL